MQKVGRNEPCPCGSGKKYKSCHMNSEEHKSSNNKTLLYTLLFIFIIVIGITASYLNGKGSSTGAPPGPAPEGQVWSDEHQHYH